MFFTLQEEYNILSFRKISVEITKFDEKEELMRKMW